MGSYPQIADKRGTHDLYGPVSRMMCASYDRAMVMFLTCVKVVLLPHVDTLGNAVRIKCRALAFGGISSRTPYIHSA